MDLGIDFDLGMDMSIFDDEVKEEAGASKEQEEKPPVPPPKRATPGARRPTAGRGRGRGKSAGRGSSVSELKRQEKSRRLSARSAALVGDDDAVAQQLPDLLEKLRYLEDLVPTLREKNASLENLVESLYAQIASLESKRQAAGAAYRAGDRVWCRASLNADAWVRGVVGAHDQATGCYSVRTDDGQNLSCNVECLRPEGASAVPVSPRRHPTMGGAKPSWFSNARSARSESISEGVAPMSLRASSRVKLGGRRKGGVALDARDKAVEALIDHERSYINKMRLVVSLFMEPLRQARRVDGTPLLTLHELGCIFGNSDVVLNTHTLLMSELAARWGHWSPDSQVGDVFLRFLPLFRIYNQYVSRKISTDVDLGADNALGIREVITQGELTDGVKLVSLLRLPLNHMAKLLENVENVLSETDESHSDFQNLERACEGLRVITAEVAQSLVIQEHQHEGTSSIVNSGSVSPRPVSPRRSVPSSMEPVPGAAGTSGIPLRKSTNFLAASSKSTQKAKSWLKKITTTKTGQMNRSADEVKMRILEDIAQAEANPDLTPAERGRLKLQRAYAEQGKFEAALAVMIGPQGGDAAKTNATSVEVCNYTLEEALTELLSPTCDGELSQTFFTTYSYVTSWKTILQHFSGAYEAHTGDPSHLLSRVRQWLELNPQLRWASEGDEGITRSSRTSRPASQVLTPKKGTPARLSSPLRNVIHRKTKMVRVTKQIPRALEASEQAMVDQVGRVLEASLSLVRNANEKKASACVQYARTSTTRTVELVKLVPADDKALRGAVESLRAQVVQLTQATIAMIKGTFAEDKVSSVGEVALRVEELCEQATQMIMGPLVEQEVEVEVSYEEEEENDSAFELFFDEDSGDDRDDDQALVLAINKDSALFDEAKGSMGGGAQKLDLEQLTAILVDDEESLESNMANPSSAHFLVHMDRFVGQLRKGAPEKEFTRFYVTWKAVQPSEQESSNAGVDWRSAQQARTLLMQLRSTTGFRVRNWLTELHPRVVAAQLTLLESAEFRSIPRHEFFNNNFSDANRAPNFNFMVSQFNTWTRWVYSMILAQELPDDRRKMISYMITVSHECLELNNFNASYAFVAGLNFPGVSRLKRSWALVLPKFLRTYESLMSFWSTSKNYKTYRAALRGSMPPAIPYLGLIAKDMFHLEDAAGTLLEDKKTINFDKLSQVRSATQFIETLQKYEYDIKEDSDLMAQLLNCELMEENEAHELSLRLEPREPSPQ